MPGASPAFVAVLLVVGLVVGCGAMDGSPAHQQPLLTGPASAPWGGPEPAGMVLALGAPATAVLIDPATTTVALALVNPPRLLLARLDAVLPPGYAPPRQVPLPGPAADLVLAAEGGPLLVPVTTPGSLIRVPLDGGAPSRTELAGTPRGAVAVAQHTVVALGDRLVVLGGEQRRTIRGFTEAARLVPVGVKIGVLDRARAAVSLVDPATGETGPALRAGNGAARMVADRYNRMLVTDVHDGELLIFAGDPPILRQRFPLPGAPYALAYDSERDLVWVTLTALNEVVGLDVAGGEPVVVHRFPTVHQPDAVAVDPASGQVVVSSASGAGLQVIDPERVVR